MILTMLVCLPLSFARAADVVLNEIFFDPPDPTQPSEFIELHNASESPQDLSSWRLEGGIDFVFPSGSVMAPGGFSVLARNPAVFERRFGFRPLGPWLGTLKRGGDRLTLKDATGRLRDEVRFDSGFPWPTAARGGGASMELLHPSLPREHPGAWRSSQPKAAVAPVVLIPRESTAWRYRKGTNEVSAPASSWRLPGFTEDATWVQGQTSIGYEDNDDRTPLTDMRNNYSSVFLRHTFTGTKAQFPRQLALRVRVDDGCVVWINGKEAGRFHVPDGELAFNALALDHEAGAEFEEVLLTDSSLWTRDGLNVVAIQVFNATLGSSDLTLDAELRSPGESGASGSPTPGATNSVFTSVSPPLISEVKHLPSAPRSGEPVLVTTSVLDPASVESATLRYTVVRPGAYVRITDAAYDEGWTEIPLKDDGQDGDVRAKDGIFSALVPGSVQAHRNLVRYQMRVVGRNQAAVKVPYPDDECPNFAWFTYDGPLAWRGAVRPGAAGTDGQLRTFPTNLLNTLPAYHLVAKEADVINCQYNGSYDGVRFRGTLVYDGVVYDHVQFHNRGEFSTYVSGKNKWRFHFNRARKFAARDPWNRPYQERWSVLNLNGCSSPWAAVNRGMSGLDEAISFRVYQLLGVPSSHTHHVHFRVVDAAAEASATDQYSGDLWGLYLAVEHPNGSFLDEHGLEDGNIYKMEGNPDKKHQGPTFPPDNSDWNTFGARSSTTQPAAWWRTNLNLQAYYSFHVGNRIVGNVDLREGWNHYFYHSPRGLWSPIPWDLDMQFIPKTHWSGTIAQKACLSTPELRIEFVNRAREILDLLLDDAGESGGQIGQLIDELADRLRPEGVALTWPELDQALWNYHPRTTGDGSAGGQTNHKGNFFRTPFSDSRIGGSWTRRLDSPDFSGFLAYLRDYCTDTFTNATWSANNGQQKGHGYRFVASEANDPAIPARPAIRYAGSAGFAAHDLRFSASPFEDPQGADTFRSMEWRIGEISGPGIAGYTQGTPRVYEVEPLWNSGEIRVQGGETRIPASHLRVGHTYRVRARYFDNTGRASSWSAPITFTAGKPGVDAMRRDLRVTEIMYHPVEANLEEERAGHSTSDFEFIEITNLGETTHDLSDVRVTGGIQYFFPAGTTLAPGVSLILAGNSAGFISRQGMNQPILGVFTGKLANDTDTVRLSYGIDTVLAEVVYQDKTPWPESADGSGPSLEWVGAAGQDQSSVLLWKATPTKGGSPGSRGGLSYAEWAAGRSVLADPSADPDRDGSANWAEFAVGSDPLAASPGFQITVTYVSTPSPELRVTSRRNPRAVGVQFVLESSEDLTVWHPDGQLDSLEHLSFNEAIVTHRVPITAAQGTSKFLRLRLTKGF